MTPVMYTDRQAPTFTPEVIVSPTHANPCCETMMRPYTKIATETRYVFRYKRCLLCGFTVKEIVRELDTTDYSELRAELNAIGTRGWHGGYTSDMRRVAAAKEAE